MFWQHEKNCPRDLRLCTHGMMLLKRRVDDVSETRPMFVIMSRQSTRVLVRLLSAPVFSRALLWSNRASLLSIKHPISCGNFLLRSFSSDLGQSKQPRRFPIQPSSFNIGHAKFFVGIKEEPKIPLSVKISDHIFIDKFDKQTRRNKHLIRMSLSAAKSLLEKLEQVDTSVPFYVSSLIDEEMNMLIDLEVTSKRGEGLTVIDQSSYGKAGSKTILLTPESLPLLQNALAKVLRRHDKENNPEISVYEELSLNTLDVDSEEVQVALLKRKASGMIIFYCKRVTKSGLKHGFMMSIPQAKRLFELLKEVREIAAKKQGETLLNSSIYEKSFEMTSYRGVERKITVRLGTGKSGRDQGKMMLFMDNHSVIPEQEPGSYFLMPSCHIPAFLECYEAILQEYERLNLTLDDSRPPQAVTKANKNPSDDPQLTNEIKEVKTRTLAKIAVLKKEWSGTDEEWKHEEDRILAKFADEARTIYKKHGYL